MTYQGLPLCSECHQPVTEMSAPPLPNLDNGQLGAAMNGPCGHVAHIYVPYEPTGHEHS